MLECYGGEVYRKSYTRKQKSGKSVRIAGRCIRSQTKYSSRPRRDRTRLRGVRLTKRTLKACPKGFVKRASYMRYTKRGLHSLVPEQCIRNVGAPGLGYTDGPGIGVLRKGELAKHGYTDVADMSVSARHAALARAIDEFGSLGVWRKLNAVAVYTKRTSPRSSARFKADMEWIRSTYGIKAF